MIRDYEKTKPRLFIRLLNADKYSADLQDAVYKTLGDIALVLYMKVTEYEGCVTSTKNPAGNAGAVGGKNVMRCLRRQFSIRIL